MADEEKKENEFLEYLNGLRRDNPQIDPNAFKCGYDTDPADLWAIGDVPQFLMQDIRAEFERIFKK